jgi:cobalt-precorrin-5B (C1)-methyltransferase
MSDAPSKAPRDRSKMRTGFTTGANATAAALAATRALITQTAQEIVTIHLPIGQDATFAVHTCEFGADYARCSCIKDGGDDPDVTHGAEIGATVRWLESPGVILDRGPGVGLVTKPGLGLEVGGPAINPVPRRMITEHVIAEAGEILYERGLRVEIWVTKGEEIAKRTLNARLGILDGISILGTTGIVIPYSTAAYRASVAQGIDVAVNQGLTHLVLTTGGRSERFARAILPDLPEVCFIQMGEFLGWSLKEATKRPAIKKVTVAGMVGKLSKTAQGKFQLHVTNSQVDPLFLAEVAAGCGAPAHVVAEIQGANTARHFQEICIREGITAVFDRLCESCCVEMREYVKTAFTIETIMTDFEGPLLGRAEVEGRKYDAQEITQAHLAIPDGDDED